MESAALLQHTHHTTSQPLAPVVTAVSPTTLATNSNRKRKIKINIYIAQRDESQQTQRQREELLKKAKN
jgi:hypothetical protein